jgi:hypothetical protein
MNSGEAETRIRPEISLKKAFALNFWAFVKVYFSSPNKSNHMIYTIMIPMQLMESKSKSLKCQNNHHGFLSQVSLVIHDIVGMFE